MSVAFGTSGLRGLATDFTEAVCADHIAAFLSTLGGVRAKKVFLGADLRASSPDIARACAAAVLSQNWELVWAGIVPTPALAAAALREGAAAIMVTGSHIPPAFNGIKFYKPQGELLKDDETHIRALIGQQSGTGVPSVLVGLPDPDHSVAQRYIARYVDAFGKGILAGLRLGAYMHSAAGRDLLVAILEGLGAEVVAFGGSEAFVAIDTEALGADTVAACRAAITEHGLDAVVSTDGDGDRPLLIDGNGDQVNGDVLCMSAAHALGIRHVVTPLTSTTAIEASGWFDSVMRTRIGSPYVVSGMETAAQPVAGFEANGGFLLGSDLEMPLGRLTALPTRDAILPLVVVLADCVGKGVSVCEVCNAVPPRFMRADRLKSIDGARSTVFLAQLAQSKDMQQAIYSDLSTSIEINHTDGLRFVTSDGRIIHFRKSGNAPELRCYVETSSGVETAELLDLIMGRLAAYFDQNL